MILTLTFCNAQVVMITNIWVKYGTEVRASIICRKIIIVYTSSDDNSIWYNK